jgi:hypothetical protein
MTARNRNCLKRYPIQLVAAILASVLLFYAATLRAQHPKKSGTAKLPTSAVHLPSTHPFEPAEELVYVAEFSRALLKKVDIADFRFTASKQPLLQQASYDRFKGDDAENSYQLKFTGDVTSKGFFAKLFNLRFREQIESIVDAASFTVSKTKRVDEQGKRARVSETNYRDGKITWVERDPNDPSRPPREAVANFAGQVQDILSAIYYVRTQPLEVGKSFEIVITDSGVVYHVPVRVMEKKLKKTMLGRVETFRIDPQVFGADRMISDDGEFSIWITSDSKRIPVSARIKLKYGTFDITLRKVIRNPQPAAIASNGE